MDAIDLRAARALLYSLPWPLGNIIEISQLSPKKTKTEEKDERLSAAKGHWAAELAVR